MGDDDLISTETMEICDSLAQGVSSRLRVGAKFGGCEVVQGRSYVRTGWIGVFVGIELNRLTILGLFAPAIPLHALNVGTLVSAHEDASGGCSSLAGAESGATAGSGSAGPKR